MNNSLLFLKRAPFLKLVPALATGIVIQWYCTIPGEFWLICLLTSLFLFTLFFILPIFHRFKLLSIAGVFVFFSLFSIGALLVNAHDIRLHKNWFANDYQSNDLLLVSIEEPLIEKTNSFKAIARIRSVCRNQHLNHAFGKIILYFKKDSSLKQINYGTTLLLKKYLQPVRNAGNPGGFNFQRYCLFQGITHQAYLTQKDYLLLPDLNRHFFRSFLFESKQLILDILRKNIPGTKECGLAEALLIGYKNDLDRSLVQSYTNTGVVHIIAISGLHLGLIYWLLALISRPLQKSRRWKWLRPVLIIASLWLFSFIAGAQASVLRSTLMFTCIVLGESLGRKTSIYNTLAFSAFILLCLDPFVLWDVGFQLSYAAVLSIIVFFQPIYNWFFIQNKILDFLWKLNAVTLAAQILTLPFCIYHFHQFPNYFLLTNLVAVPLSSLILLGEIFLCAVSWWKDLSQLVGRILSFLIDCMNTWIEKIEALPFSVWPNLQLTLAQTILLLLFFSFIGYYLLEKNKSALFISLTTLLFFLALRSLSFINANQQQKLIIYNIPKKTAVDLFDGRKCQFLGDTDIIKDEFLRNFNLQPARIAYRASPPAQELPQRVAVFQNEKKCFMIISTTINLESGGIKKPIDVLLIRNNLKQPIAELRNIFDIRKIIFDGSSSARRIERWKKECDSMRINYHDVTAQGAFVMNFQ